MLNIALICTRHPFLTKASIFIAALIPLLILVFDFYNDELGINPFERIIRTTGLWALIFLLITLAITPLRNLMEHVMVWMGLNWGRRLSDWNWMIKQRRMLGLYSFFYASLHFAIYLVLDQGLLLEEILWDISDRPFIVMGIVTWLLLVPLAITSTNKMMRRLGKNWRRLHRLVYLIGITAIIHFWWLSKVGVYDPLPYTILLVLMLGYRVVAARVKGVRASNDTGMEVAER